MSYSLKEHIAECYRRADEYKMLYYRAPSSDERERYFSTSLQFLCLAENLEKKRRPDAVTRESAKSAPRRG